MRQVGKFLVLSILFLLLFMGYSATTARGNSICNVAGQCVCTITTDNVTPSPGLVTQNFTITFNNDISSTAQPWHLYLNFQPSGSVIPNTQVLNSTDIPGGLVTSGDNSFISNNNITENTLAGNTYHISATWDATTAVNADAWYPQFSNNNNDGCILDTPIKFYEPSSSINVYLHQIGSGKNISGLFLDNIAPSKNGNKHVDSDPIDYVSGNPWKIVGSWTEQPVSNMRSLQTLSGVDVWLGLQDANDRGTNFDVLTEFYKNDEPITTGLTRCITGLAHGVNQTTHMTLPFFDFDHLHVSSTDTLTIKIYTRIGTNADDSKCAGNDNASGLRLYFDSVDKPSSFSKTVTTN